YLYDVVDGPDGNDPACRPNQVFAISLPHPVLEPGRWKPVLAVVRAKLLTPVGLRSLSPDHPAYKPPYYAPLRARPPTYHHAHPRSASPSAEGRHPTPRPWRSTSR